MTSAPHIRTGALRHRAELQSKVTEDDGGGGQAVTWVTERGLWCRIRPLSGSQRLEGMRLQSTVSHEIYTRYQADVDPDVVTTKRIRCGNAVYKILAAFLPNELPEFVHIIAERGGAT